MRKHLRRGASLDDGAPQGRDSGPDGATSPDASGAEPDGGTDKGPPESNVGPVGLAAMGPSAFERLAHLRTGEHARRESSFDRSGANDDFVSASNFLYTDDKGDQVYVDQRGPGCLYRIWFTSSTGSWLAPGPTAARRQRRFAITSFLFRRS